MADYSYNRPLIRRVAIYTKGDHYIGRFAAHNTARSAFRVSLSPPHILVGAESRATFPIFAPRYRRLAPQFRNPCHDCSTSCHKFEIGATHGGGRLRPVLARSASNSPIRKAGHSHEGSQPDGSVSLPVGFPTGNPMGLVRDPDHGLAELDLAPEGELSDFNGSFEPVERSDKQLRCLPQDVTTLVTEQVVGDQTELERAIRVVNMVIAKLDRAVERSEKQLRCLPQDVATLVTEQVVGESYYRYDSTHTYNPTVVFKFREVGASTYPRVSQIKLRYPNSNQELEENEVLRLRQGCQKAVGLQYEYGNVRCNYVAPRGRSKTTIFAAERTSAEQVLSSLLPLVDDAFDPDYLSVTIDRKRPNLSARRLRLLESEPLVARDRGTFTMELCKAVLLVNGLAKPVLLFSAGPQGLPAS